MAEAEKIPRILTLGFDDASDEDCNPKVARYGRCVEEVTFTNLEAAWNSDVEATVRDRAQWKNMSRGYAELWDDIAHRWQVADDPITEFIRGRDVERLPFTKQQWEATARDAESSDLSIYSLPRSSTWLGDAQWIDPRVYKDIRELTPTELVTPTEAFFPMLRTKKADGLVPSPPALLLKGRFAERLAVDNRRHPYDFMDGDPEAAGPLFEQMYPYRRGMQNEDGDDDSDVPLLRFEVKDALENPTEQDLLPLRVAEFEDSLLLPGDDVYKIFDLANGEFERFYRLVGVQILRFAREEYTPTHIRVLTSLMAMESPPNEAGAGYLGADALVAASKGQMDDIGSGPTEFSGFASSRGFAINTVELPRQLIEKHIVEFDEWGNPSEEFTEELLDRIIDEMEENLRGDIRENRDSYKLRSLDDEYIASWAQNAAFPGRTPEVVKFFKRIALDLLVSRLDVEEKERIETGMLLDHMNLAIRRGFGGKDSPTLAPADLEGRSTDAWLEVLGMHGMYPELIPDRPGVVNPVAICTTTDRLAALDEPTFRKIDIDILVTGPGWFARTPDTAADLLWEVRERVPFVMVDDPSKNPPQIDPLVSLPGDRAVYRIRWSVWSGWHLFWAVEPLSEEDPNAARRIALRVGAVCDDTVMAAPELVPTLARAAMLDDNFRPPVPVHNPGKTEKPTRNQKDADLKKELADETQEDLEGSQRDVTTVGEALDGDGTAQIEAGRMLIGALRFNPGRKKMRNGIDVTPVETEHVSYIRDLMQAPLRRLVRQKPLLLSVFDNATPGEREPIWDFSPRTPYFQVQSKTAPGEFLRTAAWSLEIEPVDSEIRTVMISPAHLATELLNTAELKQVWRRRKTSDWNFGGGVGFFPYRYTQYGCEPFSPEELRNWTGSVAQCSDGGTYAPQASEVEGMSVDLTALNIQWLVNDKRIGIEFGPEAHLDILMPGPSRFYDGDRPVTGVLVKNESGEYVEFGERTSYDWSFRIQGGVLVGIRFAPNPSPLWRRSSKRFPWGAPLPDGSSSLGRVHFGLRTGFLMGPSFDGFEGTVILEGWSGWSVRSLRGKQATFTPYHPAILIGPYVRGSLGMPLVPDPARYLQTDYHIAIAVGLRVQFRLTKQPELKVEAPEI